MWEVLTGLPRFFLSWRKHLFQGSPGQLALTGAFLWQKGFPGRVATSRTSISWGPEARNPASAGFQVPLCEVFFEGQGMCLDV